MIDITHFIINYIIKACKIKITDLELAHTSPVRYQYKPSFKFHIL